MKVVIIAPPYPLEEAPSPPLGVTYVAAAFEAAGAEVRIFDYIVSRYNRETLRQALQEFEPAIVGATSVTMNFPSAVDIIADVKAIDPSIMTLMGGPHVSFDVDNTLRLHPSVDLIVVGEGEQTIAELVRALDGGDDLSSIRGIAFRRDGEIVLTEPRDHIEDLDSLPLPARHLLPLSRYLALGFPVSIITSRGCPNSCIFCLGRRMVGKRVRHRNPLAVVDEIEHILSWGFTRINVADDLFTASFEQVRQVCQEIIRRDLRFSWSAFSRVNTVTRDMLALMRDAGCDAVSFGIESGNAAMLKRVRKGITLDQAREAVRACKDVGMLAHASFMVGLPGETAETLAETRAFAENLDIYHGYHFFAPFPGTTVRANRDAYDLEILTSDWSRYDANRAVVRTAGLSAEDMNRFVVEMERELTSQWEASVRRYHDGTGTEEDILTVEGRLRTEIIFRILSEDLVEQCGFLPPDVSCGDENSAREFLRGGIVAATGADPLLVEKTVAILVDRGYIKIRREQDGAAWYWTHNRHIDMFSQSSGTCPFDSGGDGVSVEALPKATVRGRRKGRRVA